jgi:ubiquinone/menaquinone biosynthesis C-methylase UbiE
MMNKVEDSFPYRTEKGMMNIVNEMKRVLQNNMKSAIVEISKQYSVHPVEVCWA